MKKCNQCSNPYDPSEILRIYGDGVTGFCSAKCYTDSLIKPKLSQEHIDFFVRLSVNYDKPVYRKVIQFLAKEMIDEFNGIEARRDFVRALYKDGKYIDGAI